jgi:hypothetical protein
MTEKRQNVKQSEYGLLPDNGCDDNHQSETCTPHRPGVGI